LKINGIQYKTGNGSDKGEISGVGLEIIDKYLGR